MEIAEICFNPCFNGTYSLTQLGAFFLLEKYRFNPCFNGTYSLTMIQKSTKIKPKKVLILVLMELTL